MSSLTIGGTELISGTFIWKGEQGVMDIDQIAADILESRAVLMKFYYHCADNHVDIPEPLKKELEAQRIKQIEARKAFLHVHQITVTSHIKEIEGLIKSVEVHSPHLETCDKEKIEVELQEELKALKQQLNSTRTITMRELLTTAGIL